MFSAMYKDDRTSFDQDAASWGIGYTVANNTESGTGNSGYNLGIRHTF